MSKSEQIINGLVSAMTQKDKTVTAAYDTQGTVTRVDGDTAWVHIPGGVDETPVKLTINAKYGDTVQVRVSGGTAWLVGNNTAPPTDDTKAIEAEQVARDAAGTATSFVTDTSDGVFVHPKNNTKDGVRITDTIEIIKGGLSYIRAYVESGIGKVRVGLMNAGHSIIDSNGMRVYGGDGSAQIANLGYGEGNTESGTATAPYFTLGVRAGSTVGNYSMVEGYNNSATAFAAHAEGSGTAATAPYAHAEGKETTASASYAHAGGVGNTAAYAGQTVIGKYATSPAADDLFMVGNGADASNRANAVRLKDDGHVEFSGAVGSGLTWSSVAGMESAMTGLSLDRPYLFYAGSSWTDATGAGGSDAFGMIAKTSTTDWRMIFIAGSNVYKSVYDTSTQTFSTVQIG